MQEELELPRTTSGRRVDLRITVQRNQTGAWQVTATTVRIGKRGAQVTNHHAGGTSFSWSAPHAKQLLDGAVISSADVKHCRLAALRVAEILQETEPNLAFLGIDIAPIEDCCYVYDCNTKPGRDILTDEEIRRMMERLAGFAVYQMKTHYPQS